MVVVFGAFRVIVECREGAVVGDIFVGDVVFYAVSVVYSALVDIEDSAENDVYFSDYIGDEWRVYGVVLFDRDVDFSFIYRVCRSIWHRVWSRVRVIAANVLVCTVWTRVRDWTSHLGESLWRFRVRAVD